LHSRGWPLAPFAQTRNPREGVFCPRRGKAWGMPEYNTRLVGYPNDSRGSRNRGAPPAPLEIRGEKPLKPQKGGKALHFLGNPLQRVYTSIPCSGRAKPPTPSTRERTQGKEGEARPPGDTSGIHTDRTLPPGPPEKTGHGTEHGGTPGCQRTTSVLTATTSM
jgi:hypothetical protein